MTTLRITAQYYENYGEENNPYWKPKGGQEFTVKVDLDTYMYAKEQVEKSIQRALDHESDWHNKYELVDIEPVFHEPIVINQKRFDATMKQELMKVSEVIN